MHQRSPRLAPEAAQRLHQLAALEKVLAGDAASTIEIMVTAGWPADVAFDFYRGWITDFVAGAADRGFCEWMAGRS